jgi:eukaryotic-like serine/threonine-protein kinase
VPQNEVEPGAGTASARVGGKYEMVPGRPLEQLRTAQAAAFAAINVERSADQLFGLVCSPELPQRASVIDGLHVLNLEGILTPLAWGVVDWGGRRNFAIVFDRPSGPRIAATPTDVIIPISEDELVHNILPSLVSSLRGLFTGGLTHRSIRPTNLFRQANGRTLLLGECVTGPPAMAQPLFYETIENGMAMPAGRGDGTPADDMYALGATIAFLLLGRDPRSDMPPEQLLLEKINRGSYIAMLAGARIPARLVEPLRGLLADDPRERWTIQDLDVWLQRRRIAAKQVSFTKRSTRALEFAGQSYFTARSLAHAFARDQGAAARMIGSAEFDVWLHRSLADPERSAMLRAALAEVGDAGVATMPEARIIARVCTALDPLAPIRFNDMAAAVDGIGTALVVAIATKGPVAALAQALAARLPQFWFSAQGTLRPEQAVMLKGIERLRFQLEDRRPGFGIERVLYELNPKLHCLSPLIEREHVIDAGDVLRALETTAAHGRAEGELVDRHIAAFLAVHFRLAGADWHEPLASSDPNRRTLGTLLLLARLQGHLGPAAVPALSDRLARQLPALIDRLHNRDRRTQFKAEAAKLAAKGNLADLLALVDNAYENRRDVHEFAAAQREHAQIERALSLLAVGAPARPAHAAEVGGRYSVATANILAWITAIAAAVLGS